MTQLHKNLEDIVAIFAKETGIDIKNRGHGIHQIGAAVREYMNNRAVAGQVRHRLTSYKQVLVKSLDDINNLELPE